MTGTDLFAYAQNRPTVLTDPTGLAAAQNVQICKGTAFKNAGHICCDKGKLVPCVPPGKGPHYDCLIVHEQCHIDDCLAMGVGMGAPQCTGRPCQPVKCGTDECTAHRKQWECLLRKGVSARDAAYVKKSAKRYGCNMSGW
jgi:hypothetical protein